MKNTPAIYIVYTSSFEGNSCIEIYKMSHQIFYFLLFCTSLYIIRCRHFSQIFRTSLNIICKKDFRHEFSLLL